MEPIPLTEIQKKRKAWWAGRFKPGMSLEEVFRLNEQLVTLYPKTQEERDEEAKGWEGVPMFEL